GAGLRRAGVREAPRLRALRLLPADLPDLRGDGARDGLAPRPDLPDEGPRRRAPGPRRRRATPPLALPRLPGVRDGLPGRRPVRRPGGGGEGGDRAAPAPRARPGAAPAPGPRHPPPQSGGAARAG